MKVVTKMWCAITNRDVILLSNNFKDLTELQFIEGNQSNEINS